MRALPTVAMLGLLLAACSRDSNPEGQVVATVNGEEVTRSELNAALADANVDPKANKAALQNAVLDRLITQRLVVQAAKTANIDKSQEYLLASRRADDQILSGLYTRRVVQSLRTPYAQDADRMIMDNPTRFGQRVVFLMNQVRMPDGTFDERSLQGLDSFDAVIAKLDAAKVKYERGEATVDSATLEPAGYRQLASLPKGQPFVLHQNGLTLVSAIVEVQPAPLEGDKAKAAALQMIRQKSVEDALKKRIDSLRAGAKIKYQPGFAAPKPAGPPAK